MTRKLKNLAPIILFAAFYILASYLTGLFFTPAQTYVTTAVLLICIVGLFVYGRFTFRLQTWALLLALYGIYTLLTSLWAAAPQLAVSGAVVVMASVAVALFATGFTETQRRIVLFIVATLGGVLFLFGLGVAVKFWSYNAAVVFDNTVRNTLMNSIFQYHNTFGAFELSAATLGIGLAVAVNRRWLRTWYFSVSALSLVGVIVSYSREVWLLTPVALLLIVIFNGVQKKLSRTIGVLCYSLVAAILGVPFAISALSHGKFVSAILVVVITVGISILTSFCDSYLAKALRNKVVRNVGGVVGLVLIVGAAVFLVHHEAAKLNPLLSRVKSIDLRDFSLQQRLLFYRAALRMWLDNPIFGSGWGTWTAKFQAYEQYPYWATKSHSILINNLLNGGIIGLFLWLASIVASIVAFVRQVRSNKDLAGYRTAALVASLMMLLHGLFDFDFSFPMVSVTFFLLLAIGAGNIGERVEETQAEQMRGARKSTTNSRNVFAGTTLGIFIPTTFLTVVLGFMLTVEQHYVSQSNSASGTTKESLLQKAISWAPFDPTPHLTLAQYADQQFLQTKSAADGQLAWQQAQIAASKGRWDPGVQMSVASIAYQLGHLPEAEQWANQCVVDGPFHTQYPNTYMGITLWATVLQYKQSPTAAKGNFQAIVNTLHTAQQNVKNEQHMPYGFHQEWPYNVTPQMQAYAAAADFALGNFDASLMDIEGLSTNGLDSSTQGLLNLVTVLDRQRLKQKNPQTSTLLKAVLADQTLKAEYQYLTGIQPLHA